MNRVTNPLLMIFPEELLGVLLAGMLVAGGLLMVVGVRRMGGALVALAIAMPFISVGVEALFNDFFAALPEDYVQPVAWAIMAIAYAAVGLAFLRLLVGQKAVDDAKGQLLADAVRWCFRMLFSRPMLLLLWIPGLAYAIWRLA